MNPKILLGTALTMGGVTGAWVDQANAYGQLLVTAGGIVVAILTAWYTWGRIQKQRKEDNDQ
jgi:uncharacterized membrane protein